MFAKRISPRARVESLESRCLLSAAPLSAAAVHTHPTPPTVLGTYDGSYAATNGQTGEITITFSSEGKTGKLGGTLTILGTGTLGIAGAVTVKDKISFHGSVKHFSITASGSVGTDTIAGKFSVSAKHGGHGTFSATLVTATV
jgi:hypothetical protein